MRHARPPRATSGASLPNSSCTIRTIGSTLVLTAALAACGGGGGSGDTGIDNGLDGTPDAGAANPGSGAVSGRVADGYIRGARVCVDLNDNQQCDDGEPSAITGPGGVYSLDIPDTAAGLPIVADIPADAIDEDTGESVGRAMVFAAPAAHPEFLSPMTTLVVEEMRNNPALDATEAEASLKAVLGVSNDRVSLFTDYVEHGNDDSDVERAAEFRYLHETARVVASMMKDIDARVEQQASASGIDVAGDTDTQHAIREIVRSEVKNLLPAIAQEVGQLIDTREGTSGETDSGNTADADFDPDALAAQLAPVQEIDGLGDRIEAIKSEIAARKGDMRTLLQAGMYWMDVRCDNAAGTSDCTPEYGRVSLNADGTAIEEETYVYDASAAGWIEVDAGAGDDGSVETPWAWYLDDGKWVAMSDRDGPAGNVSFTDDGDAILETEFGPSTVSATVFTVGNTPLLHHLDKLHEFEERDGEGDADTSDNGSDNGTTAEPSDGSGSDGVALDDADAGDGTSDMAALDGVLFPDGAEIHYLNIEQPQPEVLLYNWHDPLGGGCEDSGGNCNVLHQVDASGVVLPISGVSELLTLAKDGVHLGGMAYDEERQRGITLVLTDDADETNGTGGVAEWLLEPAWTYGYPGDNGESPTMPEPGDTVDPSIIDPAHIDPSMIDPAMGIDPQTLPGLTPPEVVATLDPQLVKQNCEMAEQYASMYQGGSGQDPFLGSPDGSNIDPAMPTSSGEPMPAAELVIMLIDPATDMLVLTPDGEPVIVDCHLLASGQYYLDDTTMAQDVSVTGTADGVDAPRATTRWRVITLAGQRMVEVDLPLFLRHADEHRGAKSMLLIEEGEFLRRGVRQQASTMERATTFNQTAFDLVDALLTEKLAGGL